MNHTRTSRFVLIALLGCSCNPSPKQEAPQVASAPATTADANEVTLSDEQIKMADITIGKVETGAVHGILKVTGTIDVPPGNMASVSFPLGGYVKNLKLLPGTLVRKGAPLVQLEDQQFIQLQQDYLMALSRLEFLRQDYARQKELNASKASSDKQFQQAESDFQSQKVLVKALDEKLRLIGLDPSALNETNITRLLTVTAPISGMVTKVNVNNGQYINPTDVICEVVNDDDKHLGLTILEKDINQQIEEVLIEILPEAFAVVRETARRLKENAEIHVSASDFDRSLEEAAMDLGATPWVTFLTVTLPLSLPGILAGCLMMFIPAVGEFVIPDLLGGTQTLMIGKVLWDEFFTNADWPLASAVAICLLVLLVAPIALFQRQQARSLERKS